MLRTIIAAVFRSRGKRKLSKSELTYILSFDLKWFSHDKSREIVELAEEQGLLHKKNGDLAPSFNLESIEIPLDFKPDLKKITSSTFNKITQEVGERSGKRLSEVVAIINKKQDELENLLDVEVVALLVAKQFGVEVGKYIDSVWQEVLG
jgi:hypothetical protein